MNVVSRAYILEQRNRSTLTQMLYTKQLFLFCLQASIAVISCQQSLETEEVCKDLKIDASSMSLTDPSSFLLFKGSKYWEMSSDQGSLTRVQSIQETWPEIDAVEGACSVSKGFSQNPQYIFIKGSTIYIYDVDMDSKKSSLYTSGDIHNQETLSFSLPESKKFFCYSCFTEGDDLIITAIEENEEVSYKCKYTQFSLSKVKCSKGDPIPVMPANLKPKDWPTNSKCSSIAFNVADLSAVKTVYVDNSNINIFVGIDLVTTNSISSTFNCQSSAQTAVIAIIVIGFVIVIIGVVVVVFIKKRKSSDKTIPRVKSHIAATKSQIVTIDSNTGLKIKHK